jgi:hypothetical protein
MNASREIIEHSRRSPLFPSVGDRLRWRAVAEMFQSGKRREQIYSMRVAAVEPRVRSRSGRESGNDPHPRGLSKAAR